MRPTDFGTPLNLPITGRERGSPLQTTIGRVRPGLTPETLCRCWPINFRHFLFLCEDMQTTANPVGLLAVVCGPILEVGRIELER